MTSGIDTPFVRVGDAERQAAIAALTKAAADGRLTASELSDRTPRAQSARTRGELAVVLADVLPQLALAELVAGTPVRQGRGPGFSWEDPLVLTARWEDEKRRGVWDVPPFLEAHPLAANVKLNFTESTPVSLVIDIVMNGRAGNLVLVVPDGWGVDSSRVTKGMGSIKNGVAERATPGFPQLMVRGDNRLGNLVARYPGRFDLWQQRRALSKRSRRAAIGAS